MTFVLAGLAFLVLCVLWWGAEREVRRLREQVADLDSQIKVLSEPDDKSRRFQVGDKVEVEVGSATVEGKFIGVANGEKLIIAVGVTHFMADPDDVDLVDGESVVTYRDPARRHEVN